jgi:hypothetical protein
LGVRESVSAISGNQQLEKRAVRSFDAHVPPPRIELEGESDCLEWLLKRKHVRPYDFRYTDLDASRISAAKENNAKASSSAPCSRDAYATKL